MASIFDDSMFEGIENAKAPGARNPYLTDGTYWLQIDKTFQVQSDADGTKKAGVEFTVLKVIADPLGKANKAGTTAVQIWKQNKSLLGNVINFIMGSTGCKKEQITKQDTFRCFSQEQPLSGRVTEAVVQTVMLAADPKRGLPERPFTKSFFRRPVSGVELVQAGVLSAEEVLKRDLATEDDLKAAA